MEELARQETWPTLPRYAMLDLSGSSVIFTRISQCSHRYYQISIDIMRMNKLKKIDNIQKKAVSVVTMFDFFSTYYINLKHVNTVLTV